MLLGTLAAVALRAAAMLTSLDEWGYYSNKGLIAAGCVVAAVTSVLMLSYGAFANKTSLTPSFSSPATYVPTGVLGVAVIFMLTGLIRRLSEISESGIESDLFSTPLKAALTLSIPFAFFALAHLFFNTYYTDGHNLSRAWASLGTVLFLATYSALIYFSTELPINSPNKLTDELAFLAATTFFLYEARISLGREMWRAYCAVGLLAAHLCAFSSVPSLILYAVRGELASSSIEESVLSFALFIFIVSRLILTTRLREAEPAAGILAIRRFAEARAESTAAATERHAHAFAIQMTIDDLIAEDGAAPLLVAEENEEPTPEPVITENEETENEGLDAISIFDTDEVMRVAEILPDPEPFGEPLLVISDVDSPDIPGASEPKTEADGEKKATEAEPTPADAKPKRRRKTDADAKPRASKKKAQSPKVNTEDLTHPVEPSSGVLDASSDAAASENGSEESINEAGHGNEGGEAPDGAEE